MDKILGKLSNTPEHIMLEEVTLDASMYEKIARMNRALKGWREGFNGKIDISVSEENKEWLLALNKENSELITWFEFVFES